MTKIKDFTKAKHHAATRNYMAVVMDGWSDGYIVANIKKAIELEKVGYETIKVYNSHLS